MTWIVVGLLALTGGWMTFDGARALIVGDYVTPTKGPYAGQLGPWKRLVEIVGIPPRSPGMKLGFIVIGILHVTAAITMAAVGGSPGAWFVVAAAISGLWYLPFGTVADGAVLAIMALTSQVPWL